MDINELRKLPNAEKLRLVELLWDEIAATKEPIVLRPWQFDEATRRAKQLKADPSIAIDRDELWRRVNG
ncbi:MAG: addiction module protein [Pirellulaceae bacterium]|nr:addiction module protein [Pirellulaceae bacterium]